MYNHAIFTKSYPHVFCRGHSIDKVSKLDKFETVCYYKLGFDIDTVSRKQISAHGLFCFQNLPKVDLSGRSVPF